VELKEELLGVRVPFHPKLFFSPVYFSARNLESYGFIGLCCKQKVLPLAIWRFDVLLVG